MDGSTDAGRVEQELVILLSFKKDDTAREIKSYAGFFSVASPKAADANGLIITISLTIGDNESLRSEKCARCGREVNLGRWWNRRGISQHSKTKWYDGNDTKCSALAYVVLVLCPQARAAM